MHLGATSWADRVIAVGLLAAGQAQFWFGRTPGAVIRWYGIPTAICFLIVTGSVLLRRTRPTAVIVTSSVAFVVGGLFVESRVDNGPIAVFLSLILAFYSAGAHAGVAAPLLRAAGVPAIAWTVLAIFDYTRGVFDVNGPAQPVALGILAVAWLIGRELGMSRASAALLRDHARRLELDRETQARTAVLAERHRLARELHDVISHNVSVMVIQAQAGRTMLPDAAPAVAPLEVIESHGRQALDELRRMLGVLRTPEDGTPAAPQPSVQSLPSLIERVRSTGLHIDLRIEGIERPLPAGISLSAYRIIQEALTNTVRHAGAGTAAVTVRYTADVLEIEVADDGDGRPATKVLDGAGQGLAGMRERAELCHGQFRAGPRAEGGFEVVASLPYDGSRR